MSEREGEVERGIKKLETTLCFFPVLPVSSLLFFISFPIFSSAAALRPVTSELVSLFLSVLLNNNRNVCFHSSKRNKKVFPLSPRAHRLSLSSLYLLL